MADSNPMMTVLASMAEENPQLKAMVEIWQKQEEQKAMRTDERAQEEVKKLMLQLKKANMEVKRLRSEFEELQDSCSFFLEKNDELALALGSCSNCWGMLEDCSECKGHGTPGTFPINVNEFNKLILPVLIKNGMIATRKNNSKE